MAALQHWSQLIHPLQDSSFCFSGQLKRPRCLLDPTLTGLVLDLPQPTTTFRTRMYVFFLLLISLVHSSSFLRPVPVPGYLLDLETNPVPLWLAGQMRSWQEFRLLWSRPIPPISLHAIDLPSHVYLHSFRDYRYRYVLADTWAHRQSEHASSFSII